MGESLRKSRPSSSSANETSAMEGGKASAVRETREQRRERGQRQREGRKARFEHWLENGSDKLDDAWVSICPHAQSHEVEPMLISDVVEAIGTGGPIRVMTSRGRKDIYLDDNQTKVRDLFQCGCEEARILNRPRIQRLLAEMGLVTDPDTVGVEVEQPKGNVKLFYISSLIVDGASHPVRQRVVYHQPHVLGKARANDAKKWTPGVTLAALCLGLRNMQYVARYTGLYPLDLDDTSDVPDLAERAVKHPCVRLVFTSITGSGLRVCALGPVARDPEEYKKMYQKISDKLCRELGVESKADESTFDPARLTFLPYDEKIFFQP